MKPPRKPNRATLITSRVPNSGALYFKWELLLFYPAAGVSVAGYLSAGRLTSEACYGEQKDAIKDAEQMAKAFGIRIDKRILIKEDREEGGTLGQ